MAYCIRLGHRRERGILRHFFRIAYQEQTPGAPSRHLTDTFDQLWSAETPFWFATLEDEPLGCVWMGRVLDQRNAERYTHLFLLYVNADYRRQGLGTALMAQAETWAQQQGDRTIGLHVFTDNAPALTLYAQRGYLPQATFLQRQLNCKP